MQAAQRSEPAKRGPSAAKVLSICEALTERLDINGKIIAIRAATRTTSEGFWFVDDGACPGAVASEGHIWPTQIAIELPSAQRSQSSYAINFAFDSNSYDALLPRLRELAKGAADDRCIEWTFSGLFETRKDWSKARIEYANGTIRYLGFGLNNESPAQLIWKSAEAVGLIKGCEVRPAPRVRGR